MGRLRLCRVAIEARWYEGVARAARRARDRERNEGRELGAAFYEHRRMAAAARADGCRLVLQAARNEGRW